MRILVACEESQAVCIAFREREHEAYSCDLVDCSGGHPEWHIKEDVIPLLNGNCCFFTCDGDVHYIDGRWDMIVAFPPCTHLAVSGAHLFEKKRNDGRQRDGLEFFCTVLTADCDMVSVENPVNIISGNYVEKWFPDIATKYGLPIKPTQRIQPYEYGHPTRKTTCLWLKGLPKLEPTSIVDYKLQHAKGKNQNYGYGIGWCYDENGKILSWNDPRTAALRSKTFPGIAKAMAEQWG